jgi:uncharacterized protein with FMN-binding domain
MKMPNFYIAYATSKVYHQIKVVADSEEHAKKEIADGNYFAWDDIDSEDFEIEEVIFDGEQQENTNA